MKQMKFRVQWVEDHVKLTSMKIIDGFPISEIAVDNFRLFPPEY